MRMNSSSLARKTLKRKDTAELLLSKKYILIHLPDDVINQNVNIYEMSAYPLENYLGMLKRLIRSAKSEMV